MKTRIILIIAIQLFTGFELTYCGTYTQFRRPGMVLPNSTTEIKYEDLDDFIKENAPDELAYRAVQHIANLYMTKEHWKDAADVFETYRPYFPEMENLFNEIIHVLDMRDKHPVPSRKFVWEEKKTFKDPKIMLKSQGILKCNEVTVGRSGLGIFNSVYPYVELVDPDEVDQVLVQTKRNTAQGAIIGTVVGIGAWLIVKNLYEYEKEVITGYHVHNTYAITGLWQSSTTPIYKTEVRKLDKTMSIAIIALGVVSGTAIGHAIKSGWKDILASEEDGLSIDVSMNHQTFNEGRVNLVYRF